MPKPAIPAGRRPTVAPSCGADTAALSGTYGLGDRRRVDAGVLDGPSHQTGEHASGPDIDESLRPLFAKPQQ